MALAFFFALLAQALPHAGTEFHEDTLKHMQQRAEFLREKMTELLREVEQSERYHSWMGMQALLFAVLPFWKIVTVLCVFGLLFLFMWKRQKEFHGVQVNRDEESSSSEEEVKEQHGEQQEKQQPERQLVKEDKQSFLLPENFWPMQHPIANCEEMLLLLHDLIMYAKYLTAGTFYPMPEFPIRVGISYEGWQVIEEERVLYLFVPLTAPPGHVFHPELDTAGELPVRNSRIRVELKCTCRLDEELETLCFLHTPEDRLGDQYPSTLHNLCTGSYLDVKKTAHWFLMLLRNAWKCLPESATCSMYTTMTMRSCRLHVRDSYSSLYVINVVLVVQQGNTDIFLSSEETEISSIPSTTWPQTCAVAEAKFFEHIAARAEEDSFHLECLKVCSYILRGYNFSTYELKTVLMHLLTDIPMESWSRRYFVQRMDDIFLYLRCCLEEKRLDHFFIGNEAVPEEIILPREFRVSRPPNLFQHLAEDPDKHEQALYEMQQLKDRFTTLLIYRKGLREMCL
ncbi:inositol 1,4,5-trisphosphate receptor-interacting protein-like 1 [Cyrtonyx montezumae]|uniref:inositol 1,4,5-trisphosphate receptor-interacting protein-like 1 n=1 Tax=Cyrtonyx montezumae TaxID=9017 RepID=UPI0032DB5498